MWRAWYTDGRTFDGSTVEEWKQLPADGLLWVALVRDTGVTHFNGGDWYWITGEWFAYTPAAPWGSHAPHPGGCLDCTKRGAGVTDEEFAGVRRSAWQWGRSAWGALHGD